MFSSFEGQYRQKPIQSLRGASKSEDKRDLLERTQAERQNREELRQKQRCSVAIQACYRSHLVRKRKVAEWRGAFDQIVKAHRKHDMSPTNLRLITIYLCHIFDVKEDDERLVSLCQTYLQQHATGQLVIGPAIQQSTPGIFQLKRLLVLCTRYLLHIASSTRPLAVPLRMIEVFTSPITFSHMKDHSHNDIVSVIYQHLIPRGYFDCMRCLLNNKVPDTAENTATAPTPAAASIFELIMKPVTFADTAKHTELSHHLRTVLCIQGAYKYTMVLAKDTFEVAKGDKFVAIDFLLEILHTCVLRCLCRSFLIPAYSHQIARFLIPAMCDRRTGFPLGQLVRALLPSCSTNDSGAALNQPDIITSHTALPMMSTGKTHSTKSFVDTNRSRLNRLSASAVDCIQWSPWLLHAVLTIGEKQIDIMHIEDRLLYILLLQHLVPLLPDPQTRSTLDDESDDSDDDGHLMDDDSVTLESIRVECLRCLDDMSLVQCLVSAINHRPSHELCRAVCVICNTLLSQQLLPVHRSRLLYSLAFSPTFVRLLWKNCVTSYILTATGSKTTLLYMLSTGLPMSFQHTDTIVPLLSVFCSLFTHSLLTLDDQEFFDTNFGKRTMPFSMDEIVRMCVLLRDACLGIVELAHPDSRHTVHEDYRRILQSPSIQQSQLDDTPDTVTAKWAYVFKVISGLVRHLYNRDVRRQFCPHQHWLSNQITIQYERPTQMYRAQNSMFVRRRFGIGSLRSTIRTPDEEDGPPLSNKEIRKLVILTEIPFVVPFQERVRVLQKLVTDDKEQSQGDADLGPYMATSSISVMIRRNYLYEDAFDKLSFENEPNLKLCMRVQLVNVAGLDEAGVDGGGLFREFLSELLKTGFDPNRGFFQYTTDRQLYPNPQAQLLNPDYTKHYYFLGRMLGKALYENMLVELPFANFFLSKILSRHGTNLDIHHLASLDPEMYKQLISLKTYEGDVTDLALDFVVVRNDFGQTKVIELKPGGTNIAVTNDNRIEYVHLMADYFLNKQIRQHCNAFRQGMSEVIDLSWLCMFDHHELQVLISGAHIPIDIADLRRHTNYSGGYSSDHPVIAHFWRVVQSFTDQQCRQLLKFVTSCSRPPLLGFKDLYPAFCVHHAGHEPDRLPTSSTCMNLLKLPEFKDEETLRSKLLYAIESGAGFELS